jgi:hypothetical protein
MIDYEKIMADMEDKFGTLPNPDHQPIQFAHIVKLYKYYYYQQDTWKYNS